MSDVTAAEFDRQLENLLAKGYPRVVGLTVEEFTKRVEPLRVTAARLEDSGGAIDAGRIPFVTVVDGDLPAAEKAVGAGRASRQGGILGPRPGRSPALRADRDGRVAARLGVPDRRRRHRKRHAQRHTHRRAGANRGSRAVAADDRGRHRADHPPPGGRGQERRVSLPGSRCGDRRVTAFWISEGRPKLGWCWAGNPHAWLGSASCGRRAGADD